LRSAIGMQTIRLLDVVRDPSLIPFVYDYCDQWCRYCPATPRCLFYRTRDEGRAGDPRDPLTVERFEAMLEEGTRFAEAIADVTGSAVAQLDYDLAAPERSPGPPAIGDPLEVLGRTYMMRANRFLVRSGLDISRDPYFDDATPEKIVAWHHMLIASKIFRALVAADRARHGVDLQADALGTAKLVLVSIDRTLAALGEMGRRHRDPDLGALTGTLTALRAGVEARFPGARAFVRVGLDGAATC